MVIRLDGIRSHVVYDDAAHPPSWKQPIGIILHLAKHPTYMPGPRVVCQGWLARHSHFTATIRATEQLAITEVRLFFRRSPRFYAHAMGRDE
ncbi:MAG: hypothetical protein KAV00_02055 [Phycisphaerae bacterium]|nr:hypothetical protein [Phycisphaerae bacterium]